MKTMLLSGSMLALTLAVAACSSGPISVGAAGACTAAGGQCLQGGSSCADEAEASAQTCNSGAFCCLDPGRTIDNGTRDSGSRDSGTKETGLTESATKEAAAACVGTAPSCFGNDNTKCCGQDPSGQAVCSDGSWMCGAVPAPGCSKISCLAADSGTTCHSNVDCARATINTCSPCAQGQEELVCAPNGTCECSCNGLGAIDGGANGDAGPGCNTSADCNQNQMGEVQVCVQDFDPMVPGVLGSKCITNPCGSQPLSCSCAMMPACFGFGLACQIEDGGVVACSTGG